MVVPELPDELLDRIFTLCLVSVDNSCCRFTGATVSSPAESAPVQVQQPSEEHRRRHAQLLLASKRFLRIATPLLYTSVHLSTPSQVDAVADLLYLNPNVGLMIAHLRLDHAALGERLFDIATLAPNVETLFLDLRLLTLNDSVDGLSKALETGLLSPEALYVTQDQTPRELVNDHVHTKTRQLNRELLAALPSWPSLVRLASHTPAYAPSHRPCSQKHIHFDVFEPSAELAEALKTAPALEEISVGVGQARNWWTRDLASLIANPGLKAFRVRAPCADWREPLWWHLPTRAVQLVRFDGDRKLHW